MLETLSPSTPIRRVGTGDDRIENHMFQRSIYSWRVSLSSMSQPKMHQFQIEIIEKFRVECVVCFCVLESSGPPPDESTDIYKMHLRLSNS